MVQGSGPPLPAIPVRVLGGAGTAALLAAERAGAEALLATARRRYPGAVIRLADRLSRRWLERSENPYLPEIHGIAAALAVPGVYFLNVLYEWGCTSAVAPVPRGQGARLIRVLDWPFDGLGRHLVAARQRARAGDWINLTWPGFIGCVQGLAPGRFAAALNQAPMRRGSPIMVLDWAVNRAALWRNAGLPPSHLLRRVFETCADYDQAKDMLSAAPPAAPAIYLLAGPDRNQGCIIERLETRAFVTEQPAAAANHWRGPGLGGQARGEASEARQDMLEDILTGRLGQVGDDFAWLEAPILNPTTRLAMIAEPSGGRLLAQGFESDGPATAILRWSANPPQPLEKR